jgi:hypothetical protein
MWDAEWSIGLNSGVNDNRTNVSDGAAAPYARLKSSLEFRVLFGDRVHRAFFNNGPLSTANNVARYQEIVAELDDAIVAESARWGDMHRSTPYTKAEWQAEINDVVNHLNARNNIFINQLRNAGLYSTVAAPVFNQFGGQVPPGFDLTMTAPAGAIWYTLDGSDPRMIGGGIRQGAFQYTGAPIDVPAGMTVRARALVGGVWSAVNEATFTVATPANASNLRLTELHYNPANQPGVSDAQTLEFLELFNPSAQIVSLDGVRITQFANDPYVLPNGLTLAPAQRIIIARNPDVFQATYGAGINVVAAGYADDNLSNGGEPVALVGPLGQIIQSFSFDDADGWPTAADGNGKSLEIIDPFGDPASPANWRASFYRGGSPGTSGEAPAVAGDFDADADVDGADFLAWQRGLGRPQLTASAAHGDADGDRDVDAGDLDLWSSNFGQDAAAAAAFGVISAVRASDVDESFSALGQLVAERVAVRQTARPITRVASAINWNDADLAFSRLAPAKPPAVDVPVRHSAVSGDATRHAIDAAIDDLRLSDWGESLARRPRGLSRSMPV